MIYKEFGEPEKALKEIEFKEKAQAEIKNLVEERGNCAPVENVLVQETFTFKVTNTGNYIFKFWTGEDTEGNDTFLEYDIPVN